MATKRYGEDFASRKSFATTSGLQGRTPAQHRLEQWVEWDRTPPHASRPPPSDPSLRNVPSKGMNGLRVRAGPTCSDRDLFECKSNRCSLSSGGIRDMVTSTQAGVLSWFAEDASPGEELQADEPDSDEESDAGDSQVKRLVEAMHGSFVELATKRNTWYDRYDVLAQQAANNSRGRHAHHLEHIHGQECVAEDRVAAARRAQVYDPLRDDQTPPSACAHHVLTQDQDFTIEAILSLTTEANVGFRLMWDHDGAFDWDQDDIFFSLHLRRFHPDNDREVVMNDKYDGRWTSDATFVSSEYWPDIKPGQKFEVIVTKKGSCFVVLIWPGEDIYVQLPKPMGYTYRFCPKVSEWGGRPLRIVLNEDNPFSGEVRVHALTWYPTPPVTSKPWQHH
ncbi:hypothetical protein C7M84_004209 [Penaeus vannamei]|uniref:Galectin n=1 Tax=Penaeus vannamei TaxID=6689 RepID=A0A423TL40_PENVA|nr:hypothetical protein C7M84_004209 [Penaeus vannamei]